MTTLKITPLENKTAYVTGLVVVVEPCSVTLVGLAEHITDPNSLRIRLRAKGKDIAVFPSKEGDVWETNGDDATCTLDTNTVEALSVFGSGCTCLVSRECTILVEKITAPKSLFCSFTINLKNWPQVEGVDTPHNLATWPDDLAAAEEAIADQVAAFDLHTHDGTDSPQVDHADLANIGTNTHAQIDAAIAALQVLVVTNGEDIDDIETAVAAAKTLIGIHNHNGGTSQQLSHAGLSGIGTLTHAQVETALTAVDAKADANKALYDAHAHTGADGTTKVALSNVDGWAAILARLEAAEAAVVSLTNDLATLEAEAVKKTETLYTVTAPQFGTYRNINEDMTGDELARSIPTIVADLQTAGVL